MFEKENVLWILDLTSSQDGYLEFRDWLMDTFGMDFSRKLFSTSEVNRIFKMRFTLNDQQDAWIFLMELQGIEIVVPSN